MDRELAVLLENWTSSTPVEVRRATELLVVPKSIPTAMPEVEFRESMNGYYGPDGGF
jgi:hypothetical protein